MLVLGGISTSIAYWLWGRLLRDYPAAQVVPFALLVPFVGSAASSIVFGETLRSVAAGRHGHRGRRHRDHAAVEARRKSFPRSREPDAMPHSLLIAFVVFAAVMFFTPGPNNIMVLSSGLTYGFRRTLPHIAGVTIGFAFMVGAVGIGFGTIFIAFPVLQTILKYAGAAYLVYLAVAIAMSGSAQAGRQPARSDDLLGRGDVPVGQRQGLG